jgi:hypothetical protein
VTQVVSVGDVQLGIDPSGAHLSGTDHGSSTIAGLTMMMAFSNVKLSLYAGPREASCRLENTGEINRQLRVQKACEEVGALLLACDLSSSRLECVAGAWCMLPMMVRYTLLLISRNGFEYGCILLVPATQYV